MAAYQVKRTDANQQAIMDGLRKAGFCVWDTHELGGGFVDCIAGNSRGNILIECKMPGKKLNKIEQRFFDTWSGPIVVVYDAGEAIEIVKRRLEVK